MFFTAKKRRARERMERGIKILGVRESRTRLPTHLTISSLHLVYRPTFRSANGHFILDFCSSEVNAYFTTGTPSSLMPILLPSSLLMDSMGYDKCLFSTRMPHFQYRGSRNWCKRMPCESLLTQNKKMVELGLKRKIAYIRERVPNFTSTLGKARQVTSST